MSKRLSPAERLRTQIDEVFAGGQDLSRAIEQVAQLGAQLLLQCALEAQVTMMLGRERYERAASCQDACAGMRNGYCATTIKTTAGPVTLQRPKVRGTTERVADRLFGKGVTKTNALESLVIAGFVRGLSVRDVEAALAEALGPQATVSKSTVSRICTQIKTQFEAFSQRRLDDVELDYLFLDGSHFKYHVGAAAEPVLAAWGIDTDGNLIFSYTTLMTGRDAPVLSAAVYARISADTEGKSLGVQRQLEDCRKLAAARGWPVGREYVDNDISAYNGQAPARL